MNVSKDSAVDARKYCIIGAGASGLAVAKTFKQRGIPFDCLERETDIGGLWNEATPTGRVYDTAHMVSSKEFSWFDDYPMPEHYPLYPCHREALAYLRDYARQFGVLDRIEFGKSVERVEHDGAAWRVRVAGEADARRYAGIVLANGHHEVPRLPDYAGAFTGEVLHSRDYKGVSQLAGKRVLVVGAGNSGCDIAVSAVHHAESVLLSLRRGYYFVPKFTFGWPTDDVIDFIERFRLPRWLRQTLYGLSHKVLVGRSWRYGLPTPAHRILDTHPTVNSEIPSLVAHGRIGVRPDIAQLSGSTVTFTDGRSEEVDLIVFATGYRMSFPFLDDELILGSDGRPKLYLNTFHPERDDLFAAGLTQANGSMWRVADYQARLIASYIIASARASDEARRFRELKAGGGRAPYTPPTYVASERHALEVDYFGYLRTLKRLVRDFGDMATASFPRALPAATPVADTDADAERRRRQAA